MARDMGQQLGGAASVLDYLPVSTRMDMEYHVGSEFSHKYRYLKAANVFTTVLNLPYWHIMEYNYPHLMCFILKIDSPAVTIVMLLIATDAKVC